MIKKFEDFNSYKELSYYSFDWDDNILHMTTVIHMDKKSGEDWVPQDVSTEEFAKVRSDENYRLVNNDPVAAFCEFKDFGPRGQDAFLEDTKDAISKGKFAPSWNKFIDCLVDGSIFSIITARGHEPETIKRAVEYIIDTQSTKEQHNEMISNLMKFHEEFESEANEDAIIAEYLDLNYYFGVSADSFADRFRSELGEGVSGAMNPEKAKEIALKFFIEKTHEYGSTIGAKVKVGFSDDDIKNVEHIENLMRGEISLKYPLSTLRVYDTSKRGYKKIAITENMENVNNEYEYFVVYNNKVISGWEYEDDAWDNYNEVIEGNMEYEASLSVKDIEECEEEDINPFDYSNWMNVSDIGATLESKKIKKSSDKHESPEPKEDLGVEKLENIIVKFNKFKL